MGSGNGLCSVGIIENGDKDEDGDGDRGMNGNGNGCRLTGGGLAEWVAREGENRNERRGRGLEMGDVWLC